MARAAALALVVFALLAGNAQALQGGFNVYVVDGAFPTDEGAAGLLVPGAGPETSREDALASLLRGEVQNSLRGPLPNGGQAINLAQLYGSPPKPPYIIVSLPKGGTQPNDRRYPILVSGPALRDGILVSDSTRIPGLVSIADIVPTALGKDGALSSQAESDPAATLADLDARIDDHNDSRMPAGLLAGLILLAHALRSDLVIGLFLAGIVTAYLVALGLDGSAVALSPFGPSQNSRFYGLSNFLETMLLVPALGGAVFLWRRLGWPAFAGAALLSFVTVAGNRFGADGGGAIVLAVAFLLLAILLAGLRRRRLVIAVV